MSQQYDVVIVGSGINGLTSAAKLSGAKKARGFAGTRGEYWRLY